MRKLTDVAGANHQRAGYPREVGEQQEEETAQQRAAVAPQVGSQGSELVPQAGGSGNRSGFAHSAWVFACAPQTHPLYGAGGVLATGATATFGIARAEVRLPGRVAGWLLESPIEFCLRDDFNDGRIVFF